VGKSITPHPHKEGRRKTTPPKKSVLVEKEHFSIRKKILKAKTTQQ
jgi:hypothetical protein